VIRLSETLLFMLRGETWRYFIETPKYADGLIILGKIDGDAAAFNVPGFVKVTIEAVK